MATKMNLKVVSAGFCSFGLNDTGGEKASVWGGSISLGITPTDERRAKDLKVFNLNFDIKY